MRVRLPKARARARGRDTRSRRRHRRRRGFRKFSRIYRVCAAALCPRSHANMRFRGAYWSRIQAPTRRSRKKLGDIISCCGDFFDRYTHSITPPSRAIFEARVRRIWENNKVRAKNNAYVRACVRGVHDIVSCLPTPPSFSRVAFKFSTFKLARVSG